MVGIRSDWLFPPEAVRALGVPTVVGAVLDEPDPEHVTNASLLYDTNAQVIGRYAKRAIQDNQKENDYIQGCIQYLRSHPYNPSPWN